MYREVLYILILKREGMMMPHKHGSLKSCLQLSQLYVQKIMDGLNASFHDLTLSIQQNHLVYAIMPMMIL